MGLGWLDVKELNFNWLLMLEREHVLWISNDCKIEDALGTALAANPAMKWYFCNLVPERREFFENITEGKNPSQKEARKAEIAVMEAINDWIVYIFKPERYDELEFLKWDDSELTSIVDFSGKRVLDIGAGTGRLTFVATRKARVVYALEPVTNLRRYLKEKALKLGVNNLYVCDSVLTDIPFENAFFDVTMGGHVFGDEPEKEYSEMLRVTKPGGQVVLFPGNNNKDNEIHEFLVSQNFSWKIFEEPGDGFKRAYWKRI
ncbi:hypothetical protein AT15_05820 [Kosmotoga arenicorallina S304]|uniref:Methyltransferase type 11 domain-containing protein n=1 Tax=Kosmotoga arenicorallina S304 TaxID=1453497 RepID=A0A182C7K1_9BACT|nr:class I SAM-dependent methyltransferase [Kosmotoga arenicorallina]OAA31591.1 hypothetical protein AT15_05820 [Kosmotoga arenicorallina S304]